MASSFCTPVPHPLEKVEMQPLHTPMFTLPYVDPPPLPSPQKASPAVETVHSEIFLNVVVGHFLGIVPQIFSNLMCFDR